MRLCSFTYDPKGIANFALSLGTGKFLISNKHPDFKIVCDDGRTNTLQIGKMFQYQATCGCSLQGNGIYIPARLTGCSDKEQPIIQHTLNLPVLHAFSTDDTVRHLLADTTLDFQPHYDVPELKLAETAFNNSVHKEIKFSMNFKNLATQTINDAVAYPSKVDYLLHKASEVKITGPAPWYGSVIQLVFHIINVLTLLAILFLLYKYRILAAAVLMVHRPAAAREADDFDNRIDTSHIQPPVDTKDFLNKFGLATPITPSIPAVTTTNFHPHVTQHALTVVVVFIIIYYIIKRVVRAIRTRLSKHKAHTTTLHAPIYLELIANSSAASCFIPLFEIPIHKYFQYQHTFDTILPKEVHMDGPSCLTAILLTSLGIIRLEGTAPL
jgi:hypothetical protein